MLFYWNTLIIVGGESENQWAMADELHTPIIVS